MFVALREKSRASRKLVSSAFALLCAFVVLAGPSQALAYRQTMQICWRVNSRHVLSPNWWLASANNTGIKPYGIAVADVPPSSQYAFLAGDAGYLGESASVFGWAPPQDYSVWSNVYGSSPLLRSRAVAVSGKDMWVADYTQGIAKFTTSNVFQHVTMTAAETTLTYCTALAVDASGDVYVADGGGIAPNQHRISKFHANGTFTGAHLGDTGSLSANMLQDPEGLAVAPDFDVFVSDHATGKIWRYRPTNADHSSYATPTVFSTQFQAPAGLACDADGNLYVADSATQQVAKLDATGLVLARGDGSSEATTAIAPTAPKFTDPWGVAVTANGHVFVTDRTTSAVSEYTFQNQYLGATTSAYANLTVKRGRSVTFKYKVTDDWPGNCAVTLRVYKGSSLKATIKLGSVSQAVWHTKSWTCKLPVGKYTWKVYATDGTGHSQHNVAYKTLTVK